MTKLTYITQETQDQPKFAIICLHGLGASGDDLAVVTPLLQIDHLPIRFIFPNAPIKPVTINGGYQMPAWYDIHGLGVNATEDEPGILAAEQQIKDLITEQNVQGISSKHIFLLGFSQGGALALFTGLRYHEPLAGIMGLSTYLPLHETLMESTHPANQKTPVLVAHGEEDSLVPMHFAIHTKEFLTRCDYNLDYKLYPIGHTLCPEEVLDISRWLQTIMGASKSTL
jgi:phospholipase/carboxylesterase